MIVNCDSFFCVNISRKSELRGPIDKMCDVIYKNFLGLMLKPNKPRESALAGHLPEKQRYLRSFIAGSCAFKNKIIVS